MSVEDADARDGRIQVCLDEGSASPHQAFEGLRLSPSGEERGSHDVGDRPLDVLDDGPKEVVLVAEAVGEGAFGDAGVTGDRLHRGGGVPPLTEQGAGGHDEVPARRLGWRGLRRLDERARRGGMSAAELQGISRNSSQILSDLGPEIRWLQSYVTDDKISCVYGAPDEDMILEHAWWGDFPANRVTRV